MADNILAAGNTISTEEVTTLNGATVPAQQVQRVITSFRSADGTAVDGTGMVHRLDPVNDGVLDYPFGHSATNITTNATTVVKIGSGTLIGIMVNNPSALTVANLTISIFDNTAASGTSLGVLTVPFGGTTYLPFKIPMAAAFTTGLTIVTAGPTVTANITVEWR